MIIGCFKEFTNGIRDLPNELITYGTPVTIELCINTCKTNGYSYACLQNVFS